jgi:hypothetical protein
MGVQVYSYVISLHPHYSRSVPISNGDAYVRIQGKKQENEGNICISKKCHIAKHLFRFLGRILGEVRIF